MLYKTVFFFLVTLSIYTSAFAQSLSLNPSKGHIVPHDENREKIKFYKDKNEFGDPILTVNRKGVILKGKQVCSYSEGQLNLKNIATNVLKGCPSGLPIRSGISSQGEAVLAIEIEKIDGDWAVAKMDKQTIYLSLDFLGEHNVEKPAKLEAAEKIGRAEELIKDKEFLEFLGKAESCMEKSDRKCFQELISSKEMTFNTQDECSNTNPKGAKAVASCLFEGPETINSLRECSSIRKPPALDAIRRQLIAKDLICEFNKLGGKWQFTGFYLSGN